VAELSWHYVKETEEYRENIKKKSRSRSRESNTGHCELNEMLTIAPQPPSHDL
jgi:hypothetical protein